MLQEKHLKLRVTQSDRVFDALGWGRAQAGVGLAPGQELDLAFSLDENVFQEMVTLQLVIRDLRSAENGRQRVAGRRQ